ncbi:ATP-binding cassette domain-containing protein [Geoglobus acetivorans]
MMLVTTGVCKSFGNHEVLKGIDFRVAPGEFAAIFAPSGSGKTTLLNIFATVLKPDKGDVRINGKSVLKISENELNILRRDYIGYAYQSCKMVNSLTLADNLTLPLSIKGTPKSEGIRIAKEIAERLALTNRLGKYPFQLSFGERKRAVIAMALCKKPKLAIIDEPTANLDDSNGRVVLELLDEFRKSNDAAVVVATHDERVKEYADRVYFLHECGLHADVK